MEPQPTTLDQLRIALLQELQANPVEIGPIMNKLRSHTIHGGLIDPAREKDQFATWLEVVKVLWNNKQPYQTTEIASVWYETISALQQSNNERYHKGGVTHTLGGCHSACGNFARAVWFYTMAFIEDALSGRKPEINPTDGTRALRVRFNRTDTHFQEIASMAQQASIDDPTLCRFPEAIAVSLARKQDLSLPPDAGGEGIPINRTFLAVLISRLEASSNNDEKKKTLEFLASYLAVMLPNVRIIPNARTPDYEMDLIVIQKTSLPTYLLEALGRAFLVECKNLNTTVSVEQLNHFVSKMRFHRCQCGVIFSREGLSGAGGTNRRLAYARLTQLRWYQQEQCVVIVIALSHLKELVAGTLSFADVLLREYESIRFSVTDVSNGVASKTTRTSSRRRTNRGNMT